MSEFDEIKKLVEASKFDGYKAAFLGAMVGWEKSMRLTVKYIKHLTGTGFDSEQHYWVHDCETCVEIAKFVKDWEPANDVPDSRGAVEHSVQSDVGTEWVCSKCGTTNMLDVPICQACFYPRR